jgi:hypothetical protein
MQISEKSYNRQGIERIWSIDREKNLWLISKHLPVSRASRSRSRSFHEIYRK